MIHCRRIALYLLLVTLFATGSSGRDEINNEENLNSIDFNYCMDLAGPRVEYLLNEEIILPNSSSSRTIEYEYRSSATMYHLVQLTQTSTLFRKWNAFRWGVVVMPLQNLRLQPFRISIDGGGTVSAARPDSRIDTGPRIGSAQLHFTQIFRPTIIRTGTGSLVRLLFGGGGAAGFYLYDGADHVTTLPSIACYPFGGFDVKIAGRLRLNTEYYHYIGLVSEHYSSGSSMRTRFKPFSPRINIGLSWYYKGKYER